MTADRDLPHRVTARAYMPPTTARIEAAAGCIAAIALVALLAAVGVSQAVIYIIRSIA